MHSWVSKTHYPQEEYARSVALEIQSLDLEGVIVIESPARRDFGRLLREYKAKWIVDLHSGYKSIPSEESRPLYSGPAHIFSDNDEVLDMLKRWAKKEYADEMSENRYYFLFMDAGYPRPNPNFIGVELNELRHVLGYVDRSTAFADSVEFMKKLCHFLYTET